MKKFGCIFLWTFCTSSLREYSWKKVALTIGSESELLIFVYLLTQNSSILPQPIRSARSIVQNYHSNVKCFQRPLISAWMFNSTYNSKSHQSTYIPFIQKPDLTSENIVYLRPWIKLTHPDLDFQIPLYSHAPYPQVQKVNVSSHFTSHLVTYFTFTKLWTHALV